MTLLWMLASAAAGAMSTVPHVHTESWWWGPLAAAVLAHAVWRHPPRVAAACAWAFGTAWMVAGTWWLFISLNRYGGMPAPLAAASVFALGAALSLYWAAAMGLVARWRTGLARWDVPAFAAAWLAVELARGQWFTGFPWVASGYAQVDSPLAAWAPWVGVYGLGAWVALLGAAWAWAWGAGAQAQTHDRARFSAALGASASAAGPRGRLGLRRLWPALWVLASCATVAVLPQGFTQSTGTLTVSLVQTGVAQDEKFDPTRLQRLLQELQEALSQAQGRLVVAPETALPLLPQDLPEAVAAELSAPFTASAGMRAALVGLPLSTDAGGYSNSVVAWGAPPEGPSDRAYRYDKHHLVPFGEFIPWGFRWFVDLMHIPLGDFDRGAPVQASYRFAGQALAPNICYEDLFGEELAQRFHDPLGAPTVLVNLSNIAWFGPTVAVDQHLHISRLRSLELQRPMLRATNTGATAVIDHRGQVRAWLEPQVRGVLEAQTEGRQGMTPYAQWAGQLGLLPLWGLCAVVLLGAALAARTGRRWPLPGGRAP